MNKTAENSAKPRSERERNELRACLSPREVARYFRVDVKFVLDWIKKGMLKAMNCSQTEWPKYRIRMRSLEALEDRLTVIPPAPPTRRGRRAKQAIKKDYVYGKYPDYLPRD